MDPVKLYDNFHRFSSKQKRAIDKNNFTYKKIIDLISPYIKKSSVVLDYGCGVGTLDLYFGSKCKKIVGIDISNRAIQIAKSTLRNINIKDTNIQFQTLERFKKENNYNKYDVIICSEVIEHVPDDTQLISDLYSYCKKGSVLFLSTPSVNSPLHRLGVLKRFDDRVGHLRRYSVDGLKTVFSKTGFKVENVVLTEGIFRNILFTVQPLGFLIKFIKGPLVDIFSVIDNLSVRIFGESDIQIIAKKV